MQPSQRGWRLFAWMILGLLPLVAPAEEAWFSTTLTTAERASAGLDRLDDNELASLNAQIARELNLARQGDVIAFAGTFSSRRPASEHRAAGLAKLGADELRALDGYVARAIAQRPVTVPARTTPTDGAVAIDRRRGEWHGEVSMTYGRGRGGRDFYGGSVTTAYVDHATGLAAAFTLSRYEGDGLFFDRCGYPYSYGRYGTGWRHR